MAVVTATTTEVRVNPLLEISREELQRLVVEPIARVERVNGGLTNTIHKVVLRSGKSVAVKHYPEGREPFEAELVTLTLLHGTLPVPDVVSVDEDAPAIVYRWIDGITFNELRRSEPRGAFNSLAEPLGRLLAFLARTDATESFSLQPILDRAYAQLVDGRCRRRLGAPLADAIKKALEASEPALAWGSVCLVHGDLGGRNLLVQRAERDRWRITGVIDWESTTTGSPLLDLGSLFRFSDRYDAAFVDAFERGYLEASGTLPDRWHLSARLLDATWLIDALDDVRENPAMFDDCRQLLARLAAELR